MDVVKPWLVVSAAVLFSGCVLRPTKDYIVAVRGVVLDDSGIPVAGARVVLAFIRSKSQAATPIHSLAERTSESGGFAFMFSSRQPLPYVVTVRKEGFHEETVAGSAPPSTEHKIRIRRLPLWGERPMFGRPCAGCPSRR